MSNSKPKVVVTAAGAVCLVVAVNIFSSHLNRAGVENFLPGDWTFMCVPNNSEAAKSADAKVVRVGSDRSKGAAVGRVLVNNRGDHAIRGVVLHWSLSKDTATPKVVLEGNTARFNIEIAPGKAHEIEDIGVSFAKLQRQLPARALDGAFKLTIGVAEVLYDDSAKWQSPEALTKARSVKASMSCANQGCYTNPEWSTFWCGNNKDTS